MAGASFWSAYALDGEAVVWPLYLFGGLFAFFGALLLWGVFHQHVRSKIPDIVLEFSDQDFKRGRVMRIVIVQPGPARRRRIRAKIECTRQDFRWKTRRSLQDEKRTEFYKMVTEDLVYQEELIDAANVDVPANGLWRDSRDLVLSETLPASGLSDRHAIVWRLIVQGKGPLFASFRDTFEVRVA